MAIFRLRSYKAEAEVLGQPHLVEVDGDAKRMTICDVDLETALRILRSLTMGKLVGVEPDPTSAALGAGPVEPAPSTQPVRKVRVVPLPKDELVPVPAPAPVPTPEPAVASETEGSSVEEEEEEKEEEEEPKATEGDPAPTDRAEVAADSLPPAIMEAAKLRDVLLFLDKRGVHGADALVAECERLRDAVPLLSRVADLELRVRRTCKTMGLSD